METNTFNPKRSHKETVEKVITQIGKQTTKHTKGEWKVCNLQNDVFIESNNITIAGISGTVGDKECQANAKLIAVAPEMLEGILYALRFLDKSKCDTDYLNNLIKKATE